MTEDTSTGDDEGESTDERRERPVIWPGGYDRRRFLTAAGLAGAAGLSGCLGGESSDTGDGTPNGDGADGTGNGNGNGNPNGNGNGTGNGDGNGDGNDVERRERPFRVGADGFEVEREGTFEPLHVDGVNVGMGAPGLFPGQAGITRDQYARWIDQIGDLGANAIRVYTIHPPAFYEELLAYNRDADEPIYLFHGTWIAASTLEEAGDVQTVADEFHAELRRTVDVVHGETTLEPRPGHASGEYTADVSNYLLGYIPGIEWLPHVVQATNEAGNPGEYEGAYVRTQDGSPFERWLAEGLNVVAKYAADEYGTRRPVSVVNWPTTDPLDHPYEPFDVEDQVSVDPNAIVSTDAFEAGTFAVFHVYPYYPPFIKETPDYREYVDHRGEQNAYAGYLNALTDAVDQPILVGEYGVPDSRALAAKGQRGRDQGRHTEREQGEHMQSLRADIAAEDTAGGLVFTWQDEWFKRTWNLAAYSDPDRRPFWSNVQTPEQRFGLLTFDPAGKVRLDGSAADWADASEFVPEGSPVALDDGHDAQRTLTGLSVTHDAAYLNLRIAFDSLADLDWTATNLLLAIGHSGRGNTTLPLGSGAAVDPTDFLVRLAGPGDSRVRVDAYYDGFVWQYAERADLDPADFQERDSGRFTPMRVPTTSGYTIPATEEWVPFEAEETGRLRYGNANPQSPDYDSLADVHVDREGDVIELRLPWLLLNVADPSTRRALGDYWAEGEITFEEFDAISVGAATYAPDGRGEARSVFGATNLTHAIPAVTDGTLERVEYTWDTWQEPAYEERLKDSYDLVQEAFED